MSVPQIVVRRTLMMASPGPAFGIGFASSWNCPGPRNTTAFIVPLVNCSASSFSNSRSGILSVLSCKTEPLHSQDRCQVEVMPEAFANGQAKSAHYGAALRHLTQSPLYFGL